MADKTTPDAAPAPTEQVPEASSPVASPRTPRTVTLPVLPLAIVSAILVAVIFFAGGVAVGFVIADHPARTGIIQPFSPGRFAPQGGQNGQNNGQRPDLRPHNRPTTAPNNG
ncbi:MAG: hypothetical protein ABUT11_02055 [Leifsonia sp.]